MILFPEGAEPSVIQITDELNDNSVAYAIGEDAIICPEHYDYEIRMFHQKKKFSKNSQDQLLRGNKSNPRFSKRNLYANSMGTTWATYSLNPRKSMPGQVAANRNNQSYMINY